ncbi:MAG: hypothetical protein QNJ36_22085 [Calothrix sp. MO_167.B42]|nr:hypothetical protein [Calothrix sp. MO_167.B42]
MKMKQQELQAYLTLIQELLSCPHGEEWILLERHEKLVTPELVQVLEQVARQMEAGGKTDTAKYLHHWAMQIDHLFKEAVHHQSEDEKSQAYLKLIKSLLDCPSGSEVEILAVNEHLIDSNLVKLMRQVAAQMSTQNQVEAATFLNNLAAEIGRTLVPVDNFKANLQKDARQFGNLAQLHEPEKNAQEQPEHSVPENTVAKNTVPKNTINQLAAPPLDLDDSTTRRIDESLAKISQSLQKLEDILHSRLQTSNPLWYMDVLENAQAKSWVLTTEEVEELIGVKPRCEAGKNSYQRGCWVFVKAGKMGSHTGWRVMKSEVDSESVKDPNQEN